MKKAIILAVAAAVLVASPVYAKKKRKDRSVKDEITKTECGACHLPFQARFLPAGSWELIMSDLGNHFGEDASLDKETVDHIRTYLVSKATKKKRKFVKGKPPIRISNLRWFVREHRGEVSKKAMARAGTISNCSACHKRAERGRY